VLAVWSRQPALCRLRVRAEHTVELAAIDAVTARPIACSIEMCTGEAVCYTVCYTGMRSCV
jgi:hypothetical protein